MPTPNRLPTAPAATAAALTVLLSGAAALAAAPSRDELVNADYIRGRTAFEQR
jgi:hypothetical protein